MKIYYLMTVYIARLNLQTSERKEINLILTEVGTDNNLIASSVDENYRSSLVFLTDVTNYLNDFSKSLERTYIYKHITGLSWTTLRLK